MFGYLAQQSSASWHLHPLTHFQRLIKYNYFISAPFQNLSCLMTGVNTMSRWEMDFSQLRRYFKIKATSPRGAKVGFSPVQRQQEKESFKRFWGPSWFFRLHSLPFGSIITILLAEFQTTCRGSPPPVEVEGPRTANRECNEF